VAEGRSLADCEAAIDNHQSAFWQWLGAWRRAKEEEETEAWLRDHPGNPHEGWLRGHPGIPVLDYLCSLTDADAELEECHRWRAQRTASKEDILAIKSAIHLSDLKAAWDAADKDARDKFRLYITQADQEPEVA
jgi:hypothetical protein